MTRTLGVCFSGHANPYWIHVFYLLYGAQSEVRFGTPRWHELSEAKSLSIELAYDCRLRKETVQGR